MSTPAPIKRFRIAVLLHGVQLSDIMAIDIIGNLSRKYLDAGAEFFPSMAAYRDRAIQDLQIFYLADTLSPAEITPELKYMPNMTYDDCPRDLDMVLIGGNTPKTRTESARRFIKEAWTKTPLWMTTCIGSMWLADSVDLTGFRATTNRVLRGIAEKQHPEVRWEDRRWVVESKPCDGGRRGELWTSGGAGAGLDMVTEWCLQTFDKTLVNTMALYALELQPGRSFNQEYNYDMAAVMGDLVLSE